MGSRSTLSAIPPLALATLLGNTLPAQGPALELDHLYIVVQPPIAPASEALRRVGLILDPTVNRHEGQGTASIGAYFENAYLELLWLDSAIAVDSAHLSDHSDFRRAASWRLSGASPFGLGLHVLTGSAEDVPVPVRRLPASHLGPNIFYLLLRQPEESLAADIFIMPPRASVTLWLDRFRTRRPDLFAHRLGVRRITRVVVRGSAANRPRALDFAPQPIDFEPAAAQYVIVEFDDGLERQEWDLRPVLPLVLRR